MHVSVIGGGKMAAAFSKTLRADGISVFEKSSDLQLNILAAFFSGVQTLAFLKAAHLVEGSLFVDLATQKISEARACAALAAKRRVRYFAGGVTGGVSQVGSNDFTILVGGLESDADRPSWLQSLGSVRVYPSIDQAVGAKLLHNFVLILFNHVLGTVMNLAENNGISDILDILEHGTAGRALRSTSVIRDRGAEPVSSYSSELVAKDLAAIISSFPETQRLSGIDLHSLIAAHSRNGAKPFTKVANTPF